MKQATLTGDVVFVWNSRKIFLDFLPHPWYAYSMKDKNYLSKLIGASNWDDADDGEEYIRTKDGRWVRVRL